MNSIEDAHIVSVEYDDDYVALTKVVRQKNIFSKIFWSLFFVSAIPALVFSVYTAAEGRMWTGLLAPLIPTFFGLLAIGSEKIGEGILDWRDVRKAKKQADKLILKLMKKNNRQAKNRTASAVSCSIYRHKSGRPSPPRSR